jgi:hypothetical protein
MICSSLASAAWCSCSIQPVTRCRYQGRRTCTRLMPLGFLAAQILLISKRLNRGDPQPTDALTVCGDTCAHNTSRQMSQVPCGTTRSLTQPVVTGPAVLYRHMYCRHCTQPMLDTQPQPASPAASCHSLASLMQTWWTASVRCILVHVWYMWCNQPRQPTYGTCMEHVVLYRPVHMVHHGVA